MKNVHLSKKVKRGRRRGGGSNPLLFFHPGEKLCNMKYMWKIFDHNHSFEDAQILPQWCKAIFKRKRCFKNQLYQISHMFTYTGGKPWKRRYCEKCRKYFTKTTVMKRHKFCHSGAKPVLRGKLLV